MNQTVSIETSYSFKFSLIQAAQNCCQSLVLSVEEIIQNEEDNLEFPEKFEWNALDAESVDTIRRKLKHWVKCGNLNALKMLDEDLFEATVEVSIFI